MKVKSVYCEFDNTVLGCIKSNSPIKVGEFLTTLKTKERIVDTLFTDEAFMFGIKSIGLKKGSIQLEYFEEDVAIKGTVCTLEEFINHCKSFNEGNTDAPFGYTTPIY